MKIGSSNLTDLDRRTIAHALMCASNAISDLGSKAADGPKARPAVATLNRTMERLASIEALLKQVLA